MTKIEVIEAINQASKAWEDDYEAMKALFIPVFNFIKSDVDFHSFVPWYHNYFSNNREINDTTVVKFMTMTAAVHEC
jgi:hypothetical protein